MIKTVRKTFFVLSLVFFLQASSQGVLAAPTIQACRPLTSLSAIFPLAKPRATETQPLYLPIQQDVFLEQKSVAQFATPDIPNPGFVAEVGESIAPDEIVAEAEITPLPTAESTSPTQVVEQPNEGSLNAETLFAMVNAARANAGLAPVTHDERVCSLAASRGPELYNDIMVTHTMHGGFYARNLPYWASEIVIYIHTEQEAMNWWMNSSVHRAQILGDYTYACGTCAERACNIIFTNFAPKQTAPSTI